jgi:hypothetical protein
MRNSRRLCLSVATLALLFPLALSLSGSPAYAADNQVTFIFGGDVEWSLNARPPTVRYRIADPTPYGQIVYGRRDVRDQVTGDWPPIPYIDQGESGAYLKSLGLKGPSDPSKAESLSYPLLEQEEYTKDYSTDDTLLNRPLQRLAPIFHGADLVMVNCEGALSDHGRQVGSNKTPERFAISMRAAGISVVNIANNHTFDAEERGFLDTLRALSLAGIGHVGGGMDLADARKPVIVERNSIKIGILGYTQFNNFGESVFAAEGRPARPSVGFERAGAPAAVLCRQRYGLQKAGVAGSFRPFTAYHPCQIRRRFRTDGAPGSGERHRLDHRAPAEAGGGRRPTRVSGRSRGLASAWVGDELRRPRLLSR